MIKFSKRTRTLTKEFPMKLISTNPNPAGVARKSLRESPELAHGCSSHLQWFVSQTGGVTAALVATTDGFEVSSVLHQTLSAEKMAAMTSSILALGEAVLSEADLSDCQNVVIESGDGLIVMLAIGDARKELLLSVIADRNAMLGQVLWAARRCCADIRAATATMADA